VLVLVLDVIFHIFMDFVNILQDDVILILVFRLMFIISI
jgi:hypothetical protein